IVGLLCLQTAKAGGESFIASSVSVFNEILERRPDLIRAAFLPFSTDRRGEVPAGRKPWFEIPLFNWHAGLLSAISSRPSAAGRARPGRLRPAQWRRPGGRPRRHRRPGNEAVGFAGGLTMETSSPQSKATDGASHRIAQPAR